MVPSWVGADQARLAGRVRMAGSGYRFLDLGFALARGFVGISYLRFMTVMTTCCTTLDPWFVSGDRTVARSALQVNRSDDACLVLLDITTYGRYTAPIGRRIGVLLRCVDLTFQSIMYVAVLVGTDSSRDATVKCLSGAEPLQGTAGLLDSAWLNRL